MVPICAADTPPVAAGSVLEVNGGHTARPAAESRLTWGRSPSNRYSVRPFASTSVLPIGVCAIEIAALAGRRGTVFWAPPLVAAITATMATIATITMGNESRLRVIGVLLLSGRSADVGDASR